MSTVSIDLDTAIAEVNRLSSKVRWPFNSDGQMELARIAREYGRDLTHVRETIREISERWDHCPDGRELREALIGAQREPAFQGRTSCPLKACDGSGWVEVWALHTHERNPGGGSFIRKEPLTADQARTITREQLDQRKQWIYSGMKRCACSSVMTHEAGE